jgi:hypothetical protein
MAAWVNGHQRNPGGRGTWQERTVTWLGVHDGEYQPIQRSAPIKLGTVELAEQLDWP